MFNRKIATAISVTSLGIALSGTSVFADTKTGTVTQSALNIRSGPSTGYSVIGSAYKGNNLQILETSNGWYKVKLSNGQVGWGSGEYINVSGQSNPSNPSTGKTGKVTADALNVRSGPSTSNGKITMAYEGQTVSILESSNGWHKVKLSNGQVGWVSAQYISASGESNNTQNNVPNNTPNTDNSSTGKTGKVTADALNVRSGPSTNNGKITMVYRGQTVEILKSSNGWHEVKLSNGQVGWVSAQYISTSGESNNSGSNNSQNNAPNTDNSLSGKIGKVTADVLNVRSGPSTSNGMIQTTYRGQSVEILKSSNGWHEVKLSNGQVGWVSAQYISTSGDSNNGSTNNGATDTNKAQGIVNSTRAQLGKPYIWGAEGPSSFDCSGLVVYVYGQNGVSMPRIASAQAGVGTTVSQSQLQPGDLIFSSTDGSGGVTHVGIYIGNGQMIHAPQPGDVVKVTNINVSYWQSTFVTAKRVI